MTSNSPEIAGSTASDLVPNFLPDPVAAWTRSPLPSNAGGTGSDAEAAPWRGGGDALGEAVRRFEKALAGVDEDASGASGKTLQADIRPIEGQPEGARSETDRGDQDALQVPVLDPRSAPLLASMMAPAVGGNASSVPDSSRPGVGTAIASGLRLASSRSSSPQTVSLADMGLATGGGQGSVGEVGEGVTSPGEPALQSRIPHKQGTGSPTDPAPERPASPPHVVGADRFAGGEEGMAPGDPNQRAFVEQARIGMVQEAAHEESADWPGTPDSHPWVGPTVGGLANVPPAADPAPPPARNAEAVWHQVQVVAERMAVGTGTSGVHQIRLEIDSRLLPGVQAVIQVLAGQVQIEFMCANATARRRLREVAQRELGSVAGRLGLPVQLALSSAPAASSSGAPEDQETEYLHASA